MATNPIQRFQDDIDRLRIEAAKEEYLIELERQRADLTDPKTKKTDVSTKGHSAKSEKDRSHKSSDKGLNKILSEKAWPAHKQPNKSVGSDFKAKSDGKTSSVPINPPPIPKEDLDTEPDFERDIQVRTVLPQHRIFVHGS
jgi:hypothetical protein